MRSRISPSMLILGMLSSVNPIGADGIEVGFSWYTPILVIVCWWMLTRMGRLAQEVEYDKAFELFSQPMWINMLIMAFLMICVAWIGNSNAVLHYRMKVERCLLEGNIDGALKVGKKSLESDADLTMLRMYALARKGTMGESLFEYPVEANSSQMLPTDSLSTLMMYPVDSLYRFFRSSSCFPHDAYALSTVTRAQRFCAQSRCSRLSAMWLSHRSSA